MTERFTELIEWCGATNTHQLLIVEDGETVVEEFWHGADASTTFDIASMQKCLSAIVLGQLINEGILALDDPLHLHRGEGWTRMSPEQEAAVTIRHVCSMTSGLNDVFEWDCEPGTDWYYCNNGYHQVRRAMELVTGLESELLFTKRLFGPLGMADSHWVPRPEMSDPHGWVLSGVHTHARDMAAFGQAVLDRSDALGCSDNFVDEMLIGASDANPSYGLLWWVYGGERAVVPGYRRGQEFEAKKMFGGIHLDRRIAPSAPLDAVGANGAGDQRLYLVPSRRLVVVRIGEPADNMSAAGGPFDEAFWSHFPKEHP